ncbi:class IV lanthionine synthetase LanL [Sphaerisporangium krabiense]|uniref:tRNA A-37 threonylcarbamoyl transferase component Bud32 n=1 Tax=Sphaerisporangium krabiense TaxID=763782 RepID=A0A7W8Z4K7_9ACTN|nr:class IV lanthionine synthetase LanL [Sphaerisporangium krabiense]MBB5627372.1 tRNA A-37 threonylcarbamoyl transferase component Bud32 [Sphaerisporangium krabiense]
MDGTRAVAEHGQEADRHLLEDIARAALARAAGGGAAWEVRPGTPWTHVAPAGAARREQGWKLHVSATPLSAPVVLSRAADVLIRHGSAFKFAATLKTTAMLVGRNYERGGSGKFITVYPADDDLFLTLAAELHDAVAGLPGPRILSDRPWRTGSPVHYRYGVFSGVRRLTNDGSYDVALRAPDGTLVADQRQAWFTPPPWATSPVPEPAADPAGRKGSAVVLLNDRFVVRGAIRHGNKGGVYRAEDRVTGGEVIVKEARAHAAAALDGTDARDLLRHEAAMLDVLAPLGLAPRKVDLFEQGGNLFLAEEVVPGDQLRHWVAGQAAALTRESDAHARGLDPGTAAAMARKLVALVAAVHDRGYVLRDLNPNNVIVTPDGDLRLIDLEMVTEPGTPTGRAYTPGYGPPEVVDGQDTGPAPERTADLFSLGATLFHIGSGVDPVLPADLPAAEARPAHERFAVLVDAAGHAHPAVAALAPLILGLVAHDPADRWSLDRARAFLAAPPPRHAAAEPPGDRLPAAARDLMLRDGLAHIIATQAGPEAGRLWPAGAFGDTTDPLNVQYGAAGVLAVLVRAARGRPEPVARGLDDAIGRLAAWIDARLRDVPQLLPGLYFGRSGTAWALHEAARHLGDEPMAARALQLARDLPATWPNPDVCHGAAGAGLAALALWRATGDEGFAKQAAGYADALAMAAQRRPEGVMWQIPRDFDSGLAGLLHYGYAHGVAGIGTFLLLTGTALDRPAYVDLAREAGDTLARVAIEDGDSAWWPSGEGSPKERLTHWCSGSSGVGTFLARLGALTGERHRLDLARRAATAVRLARWHASPAACHGLAGDAQFLLDMADATGDPAYRAWAEELATAIHARHAVRDGRVVTPDEHHVEVTPGYNTGLAGTLDLLLRLRHGGGRMWVPGEAW